MGLSESRMLGGDERQSDRPDQPGMVGRPLRKGGRHEVTRDRWRQLARKRESAKGEDGSKFLSCAVVPQLRQPMNHERVVMKIWAEPHVEG